MQKLAQISKILNNYVLTQHQYGINDCNLMIAEYVDLLKGTNYYGELYWKYDSLESGIQYAIENNVNPKDILDKLFIAVKPNGEVISKPINESEEQEPAQVINTPEDGDILLTNMGKYYSLSIVFKEQAIAEVDGIYLMVPLSSLTPDLIYKIEVGE